MGQGHSAHYLSVRPKLLKELAGPEKGLLVFVGPEKGLWLFGPKKGLYSAASGPSLAAVRTDTTQGL